MGGIIDLIVGSPDGAVIADFKTAARSSEPLEIRWTPETGPGNKVELNPYLLGGGLWSKSGSCIASGSRPRWPWRR
jgi:hypothetical protein